MLACDLQHGVVPPENRRGGPVVEGDRPDGKELRVNHGETPGYHRPPGPLTELVAGIPDSPAAVPPDVLLATGHGHQLAH